MTELSADASCTGLLSAEVALAWSPTTSRFADGYDVYRSTTSGDQYDLVAFVPGRDSTGYIDDEVAIGGTYFYLVRASAGRRDSNPVQVHTNTPSVCLF